MEALCISLQRDVILQGGKNQASLDLPGCGRGEAVPDLTSLVLEHLGLFIPYQGPRDLCRST